MADHLVKFDTVADPVSVPTGTLLTEAARQAGVEISQPCGGQGRCGRCAVQVIEGTVRRRSALRLSEKDIESGFALACQTVVEGDVSVHVPPQEKIERRLTTDLTVAEISVPEGYHFDARQSIRRVHLTLTPPSMDDQTDDLSRVLTALRQGGFENVAVSLTRLQEMGAQLRAGNWNVTAIIDHIRGDQYRLVDLKPGHQNVVAPIWGAAIDIGTTTVTLWLVDLVSGEVRAQASEYNGQIARGEDVISRIIFSSKDGASEEMHRLVADTINKLLERTCKKASRRQIAAGGSDIYPQDVVKATISGNSTMMHLLLRIPATSIRLSPFVTAVNHIPLLRGHEVGIDIHPDGSVDCLPGVASYVGADITAGVLSSGMDDTSKISLFMDVGTNGEIVLGSREWLVTCACSAGPAFEGAGVLCGMRATSGAIEEVWVNGDDFEPTFRVIGDTKPRGICGSGLISLLAEMFMTGLVDKGGHLNTATGNQRVREGEHGWEYVIAWGDQNEDGKDIVITDVDIDNLLRAKGAIYAGYKILANSVGVPLEMTEQMLIGGSFGKYINVEKGVEIGLLPDMPWERFQFLGNTSVRGAYFALLDKNTRRRISEIAARMTYIELSADNSFYEEFMSALFLPHTDLAAFPTVEKALQGLTNDAL